MGIEPEERIDRVRLDLWGLANDLVAIDRVSNAYGLALRQCSHELDLAVKDMAADKAHSTQRRKAEQCSPPSRHSHGTP